MEGCAVSDSSLFVILGTGGFAIELDGLMSGDGIKIEGFIGSKNANKIEDRRLGNDDVLTSYSKDREFLIAIGDPSTRENLTNKLLQMSIKLGKYFHSQSYISNKSSISKGSIIYPHSTIHADVDLGMGVLINSNATIGHETKIDSFTNIGPGASIGGRCKLGKRVYVGIGASILENISIVDDVIIGAGAVVNKDINIQGTYVGVPANIN